MAAKRQREGESLGNDVSMKKFKSQSSDKNLDNFLNWCKFEGLKLGEKVTVGKEGSCAQYGMIATEDIEPGTVLFEIPRTMLLTSETSRIAQLLHEESSRLKSKSGWIPLLLALMYEYTTDESRWSHYLRLVPDFKELDLPMFWNIDTLEFELKGTGVCESVQSDLKSMKDEFDNIVLPFVKSHQQLFKSVCGEFEFYKQMVAFVMAYSFTEPDVEEDDDTDEEDAGITRAKKLPMMVPMADILNHVSKNNAHLDFGKESLTMVAVKPIKRGEEVYNTYGELANCQLLHMYGFAEAFHENIYDTVDLPIDEIYSAFVDVLPSDRDLLERKWKFLKTVGCVVDGGTYVLGLNGILTEEEMYQTLKVMTMDKMTFNEHEEKEGWSDADDEENNDSKSLSFEDIAALPVTWRTILIKVASRLLNKYSFTLEDEDMKIRNNVYHTRQQRVSSYVRYGQMKLLDTLMSVCYKDQDVEMEPV